MERKFEVVKERWRAANKIQKMGICLFGVIEVLGIAWGISQSLKAYKEDKNTILGFGVLVLYLYPLLYSFFSEVYKKDKEIKGIIERNQVGEIKKELEMFDYYTLPHFMADVLKQFSTFWIFIFIQILFKDIPELVNWNSIATALAYKGIIGISLTICLGAFAIGWIFFESIIPLTKIKHVYGILKRYGLSIERTE